MDQESAINVYTLKSVKVANYLNTLLLPGAPNRGGWGGVSTPPEFWMGGLNTCQPPLILRKKFLGGVGSP